MNNLPDYRAKITSLLSDYYSKFIINGPNPLQQEMINIRCSLKPISGSRFQPTGFPDLGPAEYIQLQDGRRVNMVLVESEQSMANHMEAVCVDRDGVFTGPLEDMPQIILKDDAGKILTTSVLESHRLGSRRLWRAGVDKMLKKELNARSKNAPLDMQKFRKLVFKHDPNTILHGAWIHQIVGGRYRLARAVISFIEAEGVERVVSGGAKHDHIEPKAKMGEGNVTYQRIAYTAERITAYFDLDVDLIKSYDLGDAPTNLLLNIMLWKIRQFLDTGLRLRSACNLAAGEITGCDMPAVDELEAKIKRLVKECKNEGSLAERPLKLCANGG